MKDATLRRKASAVNDVVSEMKKSQSVLIVNCIGLTVAETMELRKDLYAKDCTLQVVKNNIIRRAAAACGYAGVADVLHGPSAVVFSKDTMSAAKIIYAFIKKCDKLTIKAGVIEGKTLPLEDLQVLANLPDKKGMISMLLSVLEAPIRNLALAIKEVALQRG